MKKLLLTSALSLLGFIGYSQTTATDFNVADCNATMQHLFSELDAGKVVVISFVMPCSSCAPPSLAALNTVNSYSSSNPGQVLFYLADDNAGLSCVDINAWASSYGLASATIFSNAAVAMSDYGTPGMPKIVVLAGTNHLVYFNKNNSTAASGLSIAIDSALAAVGVSENVNSKVMLTVFPNPAIDVLTLEYSLTHASPIALKVVNIVGANITSLTKQEQKSVGVHNTTINISSLSNGVYFVKITSNEGVEMVKFTVAH